MRDHALQFVAAEFLHRAAGNGHDGVAGREPGGECIQSGFSVEYIDGGDRHAGGDRHFLDDIEEAALMQIRGVGIQAAASDAFRHRGAAGAELRPFVERSQSDHGERSGGHRGQHRRTEPFGFLFVRVVAGAVRVRDVQQRHRRGVGQGDRANDGKTEEHDQAGGAFARVFLGLEEVHRKKLKR